MSLLTALARAEAAAAGVAQPIATVRHLHLADRPLVFVPLALAGEANAPLAAMVGAEVDDPALLIVPQPRNRDQRFAFAAALGHIIASYVDSFRGVAEAVPVDRGRDVRYRYTDAPQLLVPNPAGVTFTRLLGRSTRFRRTDGEYPVGAAVPLLGRWLTFFAERAEHPGSSMLLAMTDALGRHWATGQSALEDAHLAALLAWIDPPTGLSGVQAAAEAEDPRRWPPAGPVTDPVFDNEVLAPAIAAYEGTATADGAAPVVVEGRITGAAAPPGGDAAARAYGELAEVLRSQLEPTWRLMWRGVALLRGLPAAASVERRWTADRDAYTDFLTYLDEGGGPQPRHDGAVAAAARLHRLERALASYEVQRAYDDPLVMADYRLTGEAFVGEVTLADPARVDESGRRPVLRPRIQVVTADPVLLPVGAVLRSPARPAQKARIVFVTPVDSGAKTEVVLELSGGMGRSLTAPPGSVPEVGERVCFTTLADDYLPPGAFPSPEETPWTHGGPPASAETGVLPPDESPIEDWS
ncbi:MAG TPA: hypothetical protein VFX60_07170 [Micromonospora sp.]|nr:hypothetical protein [Micromonospora sp.]